MCSFFNAKRWVVEHNRFYSRSVFFSNKITRASSYRCVYQYVGRSVGSKWLKEYLVYIVSVDLEVCTKFDLRYDRKIRIDRLSEHLWKSNFQKQRKRINPVVLYFEFWSHMALFWMTRRSFYAPLFLLSKQKKYGDSYCLCRKVKFLMMYGVAVSIRFALCCEVNANGFLASTQATINPLFLFDFTLKTCFVSPFTTLDRLW